MRPIYIAGIALAAAIGLSLLTWFLIRWYRSRSQEKRATQRGAAFLNVKGLVKDGEKDLTLPDESIRGMFSRAQLDGSIVLPSRALTRPAADHDQPDEIIEYHSQSGNFPRPFARLAEAEGGSVAGKRSSSASWIRYSFMSGTSLSAASQNRFSVLSGSSVDTQPTQGTARKIRQTFSPVLPDELLVSLGERLTVVQSFDDGWCVVGRENSVFIQSAKSLFQSSQSTEPSNIELGVVPAWCFMKPVKGLKAERPIRSSSLGITVQMQGPSFSSREELISWSNF
ncbi:hypothetical protein K435DRAFT_651803 [Dendrothele bispora CBS 962.96]|uniref:SH3 domain-containing protein n=1 Tax=Dendrothele bispora (strain CBS 962.96) TaxID=1314807 RepID=A0A4V4HHL8_DENBC|nr:hypothetical protein K435DRAFT_651803 [Dendrothele bispora CBS 962.96]